MNNITPFFVFSAARNDWSDDVNEQRTNTVLAHLKHCGITFIRADGHFQGNHEPAIIAVAHEYDHTREVVFRLAKRYGQACLVEVDGNRHAVMHWLATGLVECLGEWRRINSTDVNPAYGHTIVRGEYYQTSEG